MESGEREVISTNTDTVVMQANAKGHKSTYLVTVKYSFTTLSSIFFLLVVLALVCLLGLLGLVKIWIGSERIGFGAFGVLGGR